MQEMLTIGTNGNGELETFFPQPVCITRPAKQKGASDNEWQLIFMFTVLLRIIVTKG